MIINQQNLDRLFTGFKTAFRDGIGQAGDDWAKVAMKVKSSTRDEKYGWLGKVPGLREWAGDRVINNIAAHDYAMKFESTVAVARDDLEDDQVGAYGMLFTELGRASAAHPNELVFALLKNGWSTKGYDGKNFFATDHKVNGVNGNVANTDGGSGAAWFLMDISRAVKPVVFQERRSYDLRRRDRLTDPGVFERDEYTYGVDGRCAVGFGFWEFAWGSKQTLNETNYEKAREALMSMKGEQGRPLGLMPRLLVVPPSLEKEGLEIVRAERKSAGGTNVYAGTADLLVTPWLA